MQRELEKIQRTAVGPVKINQLILKQSRQRGSDLQFPGGVGDFPDRFLREKSLRTGRLPPINHPQSGFDFSSGGLAQVTEFAQVGNDPPAGAAFDPGKTAQFDDRHRFSGPDQQVGQLKVFFGH